MAHEIILTGYTFTASTKQINFTGVPNFTFARLRNIVHQPSNTFIYGAGTGQGLDGIGGTWNEATKTLTVNYDTTSFANTDALTIQYEGESVIQLESNDGTMVIAPATENGALGVGNAMKKFRDGFADLSQGSLPDSTIWDITWNNKGSSTVGRAGDTGGASYMKISMCPITAGSEFIMTTKRSFKLPMRFVNFLSLSQRVVGQEFEVSIVGCSATGQVTSLSSRADISILGSVTIASNVATINFASDHGLKTGDRIILLNNSERRLNVGPVIVTVTGLRSITVPCTLASGTYSAGGVVRWTDPLGYAKNGAGLLFENATATNSSIVSRRNGFNTRILQNQTIVTTANSSSVNYADPFLATSMNQIVANQEDFTIISRSPDSTAAPSTTVRIGQILPDEELEYKIRVRAKNLENITRPIARITAISKAGATTATVTTDVAHGLATTDFVQIYGVRDIVNFPNLSSPTQVASIVSSNQFTIVIGSASTSSSAGGTVFINQGSVPAAGVSSVNVQTFSRANNILTLTANANWTGFLPGETIQLHGCDAGSMGLYDRDYKVLRINATSLELESVGADFTSINCGGAVIKRTDLRVHAICEIEHTRLIAELSNSQGSLDSSKSIPTTVTNTPAVTVSSGTVTTVSTVTNVNTVAAVTSANLGIPSIIADVSSAALTTTSTTSAFTPTFGITYQVNIPVTAVSGTNAVLDFSIEESMDSGTNWVKVYDFPRITSTGFYQSPIIRMKGNRIRYVQNVGGTTPSFTRAVNRLQSSVNSPQMVQLINRSIDLNTADSLSPALIVEGCQDFNFLVRCSAQTSAATLNVQFSHDGTNWHDSATTLVTIEGIAHAKVQNEQWKFARLRVSVAGSGVTIGEVMIVGTGR